MTTEINTEPLTALEKELLKTLSYYKAIGVKALTTAETEKYLLFNDGSSAGFLEINKSLKNLVLRGFLHENNGFYSIEKGSNPFLERTKNSKQSLLKWRVFKNISAFLIYIPYVRGVYITGSLALGNSTDKSDIDILIKSRHSRIWSSRLFITISSHVLKRRRHGKKTRNRLCFNHYTTEKAKTYGTPLIHKTVSSIKIPVWEHNSNNKINSIYYIKSIKYFLLIKRSIEYLLHKTGIGYMVEKTTGKAQIKKINKNPIKYPKELTPPNIRSSNLVFYYPKVLKEKNRYLKNIKKLNLGHSDKLGQL